MPDLRDAPMAAHRSTVDTSIADMARYLQELLGQKLVAFMVGVQDPKTVGRWAADDREPREQAQHRLRCAFQVFQLLATKESPHTVRASFVGLHPQLDDQSPATAIREDRFRDVMVAARSFLAGG